MLTILDRYIIKRYLGTLLFILALLSAIIVVFDISQKLDDFIANKAPIHAIIFDYFFNFMPFMLNMLLPLFIFVSVIFFTSQMAARSEIISIMNSGAGINRILRPYMICAFFLTLLSIYLYNEVIPSCQQKRYKFEYQYVTPNRANVSHSIHRQVQPGIIVYIESFIYSDSLGYHFAMDHIENRSLKSRLSASRISWNKLTKKWSLENFVIRILGDKGDKLIIGQKLDTMLTFNPKDFIVDEHIVDQLNYAQLNAYIEKEQMRGSENVNWYLIEKYQRLAIPFSAFILTIIGFSVSFRRSREGMGMQLLIGLTLSFAYIILMRFAGEIARNNILPVWLSVWIPNIIYSFIAFWLYLRALL